MSDAARSVSRDYRDAPALQAALEAAANRLVTFDAGVVALDNYGRVVGVAAGSARTFWAQDWSDRQYFRDVAADRAAGLQRRDRRTDRTGSDVVVVAVPVTNDSRRDARRRWPGMFRVGATTTSALVRQHHPAARRRRACETVLVDSNGTAIYHSDVDADRAER